MRDRLCIFALTLAAGISCASTGADQQSETLQDAVIIERSTIPPYTGYIRTWIQFRVKAKGKELVVLLPHFEDGKRIPDVGETCQIHYHAEVIEGQVGDKNVRETTTHVVDQMACERAERLRSNLRQ